MRRALATATGLALLALASAASAERAEDAIRAADQRFAEAFNRGDSAALAEFYTPDAAVLPPGAPRADGRAAIERVWREVVQSGLRDLSLRPAEVVVLDGTAYVTGSGAFTMPSAAGGGTQQGTLKYLEIWQRGEDGAWRLHRDIWN
jgi:uncharacterized protein (TIGR02246 family)